MIPFGSSDIFNSLILVLFINQMIALRKNMCVCDFDFRSNKLHVPSSSFFFLSSFSILNTCNVLPNHTKPVVCLSICLFVLPLIRSFISKQLCQHLKVICRVYFPALCVARLLTLRFLIGLQLYNIYCDWPL